MLKSKRHNNYDSYDYIVDLFIVYPSDIPSKPVHIISSKLNFDETSMITDYTRLMKLKFIMDVPIIVKDTFYMVTKKKNVFILSSKNILAFKLLKK